MSISVGGGRGRPIYQGLRDLVQNAEQVSVAVSYVQLAGWELLKSQLNQGQIRSLRVICTDQFGITDPAAVRAMIADGADVRAFVPTSVVYHPKLYLARQRQGGTRFMLGSANLSKSALETGIEIDISGDDADGTLAAWFDQLFNDPRKCAVFDQARLQALDKAWDARLKSRLTYQRALGNARTGAEGAADDGELSAASVVESAFANLQPGATPLNFDKAGNNVRAMGMLREGLEGRRPLTGKLASEMKLLGFVEDGQLNALGRAAARARSDRGVADIWMRWLKAATDAELLAVNPQGRLLRARLAFRSFWTFPSEVTDFFTANAVSPPLNTKRVLQTIELLANTGRDLSQLSLADVRTLSTVIDNTSSLPEAAAGAVRRYLDNKGPRGWTVADRRVAVESWRDA